MDWTGTLAIGGVCAVLAVAFGLARYKAFAWLSPPVTALALVALLVNINLLPSSSETPVYGLLSGPMLQAAIFILLLQVDLNVFRRAGVPMLVYFFAGSLAVGVGAFAAAHYPGMRATVGNDLPGVAAMYAGTYTGGSVNFNALAAIYGVARDGVTYPVAVAIDNLMGAASIAATILIAPLLRRLPWVRVDARSAAAANQEAPPAATPLDLALVATALAAGIAGAQLLAQWLPWGHPLLWLTAIALAAAQTPLGSLGRRIESIGIFALYLFVASIGADISVPALLGAGPLALALAVMVASLFALHAITLSVVGRMMRADSDALLVASQAALGGPPTAIAVADGIGRPDLRIPGVAVALIGYAIGTYWGVVIASLVTATGV